MNWKNKLFKIIPIFAIFSALLPITLWSNKIHVLNNDISVNKTLKQNTTTNYPFLINEQYFILNKALYQQSLTIVIAGDGFTANDKQLFFEKAHEITKSMFTYPQYAILRNYINVFAVFTESKESWSIYGDKDTYFQTQKNNSKILPTATGESRLKIIEGAVSSIVGHNTFMRSHILVNTNVHAGTAHVYQDVTNKTIYSVSTLSDANNKQKRGRLFVHELSHTFNISDEYEYRNQEYTFNVTNKSDYATNKWKDFIGYDGIGIYQKTKYGITYYTPKSSCLMDSGYDTCEVCMFYIWKGIVDNIGIKKLYVAFPAISPSFDTQTEWMDSTKNIGIDWKPKYDKIQNKKIDVRSVIYNPFDTEQTVSLKSTITNNADSSQNQTFEQSFTIPAGELKQIKITSPQELIFNDYNEITIDNKIYDDNNNLLSDGNWNDIEYTKEFANKQLTINFFDENNNKLPFLTSQQFYYNNDSDINNLQQIDLPGYEKVSVSKNADNSQNWYYKILATKTLKIRILDSINEQFLDERTIKLIKNNPIFLSDVLRGTEGNYYFSLNKEIFKYEDYTNIEEITIDIYQMYHKSLFTMPPSNIIIKQGETFDITKYTKIDVYKDGKWQHNKIMSKYCVKIKETFNTNTPGNYKLTWEFNVDNTSIKSGIINVTVEPNDGQITPPEQKPDESIPMTPIQPSIPTIPMTPIQPANPIVPPITTSPNNTNNLTIIIVISIIAIVSIVGIAFLIKWLLKK